jgi:hypothetical protein
MADNYLADCQVVLAVSQCGYYRFLTAQCINDIWVENSHRKPEGTSGWRVGLYICIDYEYSFWFPILWLIVAFSVVF